MSEVPLYMWTYLGPIVVLWGGQLLMSMVVRYWGFSLTRRRNLPRALQVQYRGTSLVRKRTPLKPYRRPVPRGS